MKTIKNSLFIVVIILLFAGIGNASTNLKKLGDNPFHQPSLTSVEDLLSMVQEKEDDVKIGFDRAGRTDLIDPFISQLPDAEIELVEFPKGSTFEWMLFKKNGTGSISAIRDITWANETPFSGYKFYIDSEGNRYDFAVPLVCGNIALMGVSPTPEVVVVPVVEPEVPDCKDNEIWNALTENCDCADGYERNDMGVCLPIKADTDLSPMLAAAPLIGAGALKLLADLGYLHQFDPGYFGLARVGAEYYLTDNFSLLGLVGVAPKLGGSDGKTAFVADLLGELKFGKSFLNLGVGYWLTDGDDDIPMENTQFDLIGALGTRIFGEPDGFNGSLFLETRQGFDELGSSHEIRSFGRYGGGLRFRF